jgi:hypothetical protein
LGDLFRLPILRAGITPIKDYQSDFDSNWSTHSFHVPGYL